MNFFKNGYVNDVHLEDISQDIHAFPIWKVNSTVFPLKLREIEQIKELLEWKTRSFLTFIDDFSRKVFVYFLQSKDRVQQSFADFKTFAEIETEKTIKIFSVPTRKYEYKNRRFSRGNVAYKASDLLLLLFFL